MANTSGFCYGVGMETTDRQAALDRLIALQSSEDPEAAHSEADDVLCGLLKSLGYADVVAEWEKVERWYA
jgi:hypothetical protein